MRGSYHERQGMAKLIRPYVHTKWLIFRSIRGIPRPWIVIPPDQRGNPSEKFWEHGFASWEEAIASLSQKEDVCPQSKSTAGSLN